MSSGQYTRERKEDKPVLAICYDFDILSRIDGSAEANRSNCSIAQLKRSGGSCSIALISFLLVGLNPEYSSLMSWFIIQHPFMAAARTIIFFSFILHYFVSFVNMYFTLFHFLYL